MEFRTATFNSNGEQILRGWIEADAIRVFLQDHLLEIGRPCGTFELDIALETMAQNGEISLPTIGGGRIAYRMPEGGA